MIHYRVGNDLDFDQVVELYKASTLGERRPIDDRAAHRERTEQVRSRADDAVVAERDFAFQDRMRADLDVPAELDVAGKHGRGVNANGSFGSHAATPFLGRVPGHRSVRPDQRTVLYTPRTGPETRAFSGRPIDWASEATRRTTNGRRR